MSYISPSGDSVRSPYTFTPLFHRHHLLILLYCTLLRNQIVCKRYGSDNGNRNWSAGPWKVGCSFAISLKALHTEKKMSENPKDPQKGSMPKCRPVWEREVLIKDANVVHGGGCKPGEERIAVVKKPPKAVHPNVAVMKNGGLVNLFTKIRGKSAFIKKYKMPRSALLSALIMLFLYQR